MVAVKRIASIQVQVIRELKSRFLASSLKKTIATLAKKKNETIQPIGFYFYS